VWNLGFTPDYKLLFTTNGTSNDVTVIDVASEKAIKSIKTGRYPWGVVSSQTPMKAAENGAAQ
jgi:YVTN family beta-propeller protein